MKLGGAVLAVGLARGDRLVISAEDEQESMRMLRALLMDVGQLSMLTTGDPGEASPGSALWGDDSRMPLHAVSWPAWRHLMVAVDNLATLRDATLRGSQGQEVTYRLFGQFPLVRAALENAATVLWLLGPAARVERLRRRLLLEMSDIRNGEAARESIGSRGRRTKEHRLDSVRSLASGLGIGSVGERVSYVRMVESAGELVPEVGAQMAVFTYRLCSGLSHGDLWASMMAPHKERLDSVGAGVSTAHLTPDVERMYVITLAAKFLVDGAIEMWHLRRKGPGGE